eukprot:CAMPEP_0198153322 /NCGR_PEP_ID=MMETSP1443-20131203/63610_1 /TAXON_ID=186043 /ORGANISM="Entomoneis sp., Strain CCMP2396" /LENGTH=131 /DNA_ID=CAMNT_0043819613 /DNA_START=176 /DNA_END=571 /DNA_ORIENTATION=+
MVDYQLDHHGRGEDHLSACLNEGDVVVYQAGTWYVDGVEVGDGSTPTFHYCRVETMQIVWTHNCEHGVIRGFQMQVDQDQRLSLLLCDEDQDDSFVEFGPEQLVARLPNLEWNDSQQIAISPFPLDDALWK